MGGRTKKSKRQSGGNPDQSQLDAFVLFLDETLHNCQPIHAALANASIKYERHGAHFRSGAPDVEWLPQIGEKGWALLTCDQKIRYNQLEREKIVQYKIREFVFVSGNMNGTMMGAAIAKASEKMKRLVSTQTPPFIAYVSQSGNVTVRYDQDGSIHDRKRKAKIRETD